MHFHLFQSLMIKPLIKTINSNTMSLKFQATIIANKNPTPSCCIIPVKIHTSTTTHTSKSNLFTFPSANPRTHFPNCRFLKPQTFIFPITKVKASFGKPYGNGPATSKTQLNDFNLDAFLSVLEFLTLASSVAVYVYVAFASGVQKGPILGAKILVWQSVVLVSGVLVGAVIRRRQWGRICGFSRGSSFPSYGTNLLERVEKLEEDLRSSATIIRVLSRQLEKLGIRFRVTRKALKEPIAETAALAQKNSEATQALAAQEDILEKELGEIQKVLLAMQEQQQKQLELILAIGRAGKLWEGKKSPPAQNQNAASKPSKSSFDGVALNSERNRVESLGVSEGNQQ